MPAPRKIIHIDMDAFFASVEQRDNPNLRGRPVAVGGSGNRGVVAAASYEARRYGVHSAMSSSLAKRICPDLIFVRSRFDTYREVSGQIRNIFQDYTDLVEPLSLDEAFLDVTHNKRGMPSATLIAREIKNRIRKTTGLTASAGISINKFMAKIASDVNKPDGLFLIAPEEVVSYIEKLPIEKFFGIGQVTAEKMKKMGIFFGSDLKGYTEEDLVIRFGKPGHFYYRIVRGEDDREVNPNRIRKSIGAENTYARDITDREEMLEKLREINRELAERIWKNEARGKTVTVKIKYHDFQQITRSKTSSEWISSARVIESVFSELTGDIAPEEKGIRLLGLTLSNLDTDQPDLPVVQLTLDF